MINKTKMIICFILLAIAMYCTSQGEWNVAVIATLLAIFTRVDAGIDEITGLMALSNMVNLTDKISVVKITKEKP